MKTTVYSLVLVSMLLGGCTHRGPQPQDSGSLRLSLSCSADMAPEHQVQLEMVDTLVAQQRPYAALAHLQKTPQKNPEYWRRYGQLLAQTGDLAGAAQVFDQLRHKCRSGEAWQGAGLVSLRQGQVEQARRELQQAVALSPSSASVRNDYGYVLMMLGRYDDAIPQLRTALELQNGSGRPRQNLAAAYVLANQDAGLQLLQEQYQFTEEELLQARRLAAQLRAAP